MSTMNRAKNKLASSNEDFNSLSIEELQIKANEVGMTYSDNRNDIIDYLNRMRDKIRQVRQNNILLMTKLLKSNIPDTPRKTFIYYGKEQEIPHVGDIVYVNKINDALLGIVSEVHIGKKNDSFYKIGKLRQERFMGEGIGTSFLESRSDLYVPDDLTLVRINPKERRMGIEVKIMKNLRPWEEKELVPETKQKVYILKFASDDEIIGLFSSKKKIKAHIKKKLY